MTLHFRDIHAGDRLYENSSGCSVEVHVLTEPEQVDGDGWQFTGRTAWGNTEYFMRDSATAYAPRLDREAFYWDVIALSEQES